MAKGDVRISVIVGGREFDVLVEKLNVSWVCYFYENGKNLGFKLDTMGIPSNHQIEQKIQEELFGGTLAKE